jgi:putative oxidoreductase
MADDLTPAAVAQHTLWGALALAIALWGAGRWSLDRFTRVGGT